MNLTAKQFIREQYGDQAVQSIQPVAGGGSSRKYHRFIFQGKSYILTESDNINENQTFLYFTEHFSKTIDNLPKLYAVSSDFRFYVQSDFGDVSLLDVVTKDREASLKFYKNAISNLVKMQVLGDVNLDYSRCFSYPKFNYLLVLRDLFAFKNYFLNLVEIEFSQADLLKDFERFSFEFQNIQPQHFVYRDFQSRNIMIRDEKVCFIDYQGGLKGPPQYDLVSILWQAKTNLSEQWKTELYDFYIGQFIETTQRDLNSHAFLKGYELCLVERMLQVLGTYGFRGIFEGKAHFVESIEFGLKNLERVCDLTLWENYPEMKKVVSLLTKRETNDKIKKIIHERNSQH